MLHCDGYTCVCHHPNQSVSNPPCSIDILLQNFKSLFDEIFRDSENVDYNSVLYNDLIRHFPNRNRNIGPMSKEFAVMISIIMANVASISKRRYSYFESPVYFTTELLDKLERELNVLFYQAILEKFTNYIIPEEIEPGEIIETFEEKILDVLGRIRKEAFNAFNIEMSNVAYH